MANEKERFLTLRKKLFEAIGIELAEDNGCKSYEGALEVTLCFPNYFEDEYCDEGVILYVIELHCYVLGPSRHYRWDGRSFDVALRKAERDIYSWIGEAKMDGDGND
jgi:hypothetical protein